MFHHLLQRPRVLGPVKLQRLRSSEARELFLSLAAIILLVLVGTVGYSAIEGWNWFDSLYMTVITVATIGYGETHPLSALGRGFTIVLILLGVGVASVVLSSLTRFIIQRQIIWLFDRKTMQDAIDKLTGHTIFCGYGRLARMALQSLHGSNRHQIVLIDSDEERASTAAEDDIFVVKGDATNEEALLAAGIKRAQRLVTLLPKDADNLYVVLTAKELNPNIDIMSRAADEKGEKRLTRAGAARIISPYRVSGQKIADGILRPYVTDFLELAGSAGRTDLAIEEIRIPDNSPLTGHTLEEAQLRQRANIMVAAIIKKDGQMVFNPNKETMLESGSTLIGFGHKSDFAKLEKLLIE
ncbi:MAG: potassium channel protein [Oligoflexia bacterium]|nr:potassium channel protein [Oligoflexia bacterium]